MHNSFETLQKKCKRYHLRQVSRKTVLPLLTIIALGAGSYFFLEQSYKSSVTPLPTKVTTKIVTPPVAIIKEPKVIIAKPVIVEKKEPVTITATEPEKAVTPNKETIKRKDITYNLHVDDSYVPKRKVAKAKPKKVIEKEVIKESPKPKKQLVVNDPVPKVTITKEDDKKATNTLSMSVKKIRSTDDMISLFENEQKYSLALKISQEFYDLQQYSRASLWAKKANILDREADGAWILYAQSEYAKGHKKRAIEILKLYLANANSTEGEALILNWTQGK